MVSTDFLVRWRYRLVPDHLLGEILAKRWIDNLIPFVFLLMTVGIFGSMIRDFYTISYLTDTTRQLGEFLLIVIGLL